jgi:cell division FtsZ-interacting protein ZapD
VENLELAKLVQAQYTESNLHDTTFAIHFNNNAKTRALFRNDLTVSNVRNVREALCIKSSMEVHREALLLKQKQQQNNHNYHNHGGVDGQLLASRLQAMKEQIAHLTTFLRVELGMK